MQRASQRSGAQLHTAQANPKCVNRNGKSAAIVTDFQQEIAVPDLHLEVDPTGLTVHDRVADRLLSDAIDLVSQRQKTLYADVDAAVAVLEAQRLGVTEGEVRLFMLAWCRIDPAGA